jgi:hypothetical protein
MSHVVSTPSGTQAVKIDVLTVAVGDTVELDFESVGPRWRQGVFMATEGELWDSGRGRQAFESPGYTSGMDVHHIGAREWRYRCTDIGMPPDFSRLVFRIRTTSE